MRLRALVGSGVVVLVLAAGASAGRPLSAMTLQFGDLPTGYTQSKSYACPASCVTKETGSVSAGYLGGWERDYDGGVTQLTSAVSLYASTEAAQASILRSWAKASKACVRASLSEKIGDQARMYLCKKSGVSVYGVSWRSGKLRGTILFGGYVVAGSEAARLAVEQQARMG
jgi:hypothetical protein